MAPKSCTVRASGIPLHTSVEDLKALITGWLTEDERLSFTVTTSPYDELSQVALVTFKGIEKLPSFLSQLGEDKGSPKSVQKELPDESQISFDIHFLGITPILETQKEGQILADIIAVHGINGHPYGSWKGRNEQGVFWLQDFLKTDLPGCRVMLFGYDGRLSSSGFHRKRNFADQFLKQVKLARGSDVGQRRVILLGHSYGGHVIMEVVAKLRQTSQRQDPVLYDFRKCIYGIVFFAVPHGGMHVDDLKQMVADFGLMERGRLLDDIETTSDRLKEDLGKFKDCVDDEGYRITSCIELEQSKEVIKDGDEWITDGQLRVRVATDSAELGLPARIEEKLYWDRNHSNMVKFDSRDPSYMELRKQLRCYLQDIGRTVMDESRQKEDSIPWPKVNTIDESNCDFTPLGHVARPELFAEMEKYCFNGDVKPGKRQKVACGTVIVHGESGMGKTTLVRSFVEKYRENWSHIFFVNSDTKSTIVKSIGTIVSVYIRDGFAACDDKVTLSLFSRWLRQNSNWLILFDNPSRDAELQGFYPRDSTGLVIIASTYSFEMETTTKFGQLLGGVRVEGMSETQALERFKSIGGEWGNEQDQGIRNLVKSLGNHPFAVTLAAGWMKRHDSTSREQNLKAYPKHQEHDLSPLWRSYSMLLRTIVLEARDGETLWQRRTAENALALLQFLANVSHERFALRILENCWRNLQRRQKRLSDWQRQHQIKPFRCDYYGEWDDYFIDDSVALLSKCNLIKKWTEEGPVKPHCFVSIHPLVQQFLHEQERTSIEMREFHEPEPWLVAIVTLAESISRNRSTALTEISSTDPQEARRAVEGHLEHCLRLENGKTKQLFKYQSVDGSQYVKPTALAAILLKAALALSGAGTSEVLGKARGLQNLIMLEMEELVNKEPQDSEAQRMLTQAMLDLACTENNLGNLKEALQLRERAHGSIDRDPSYKNWEILDAKAALARSCSDNGEYEKALRLRELVRDGRAKDQVYALQLDVIVDAMREYAVSLYNVNRRQEALQERHNAVTVGFNIFSETGSEPLQRLLESGKLTCQGLNLFSDLSASYNDVGRLQEAKFIRENVVRLRRKLLGKYHVDTLFAQLDLSATLWGLSDVRGAYELRSEVFQQTRDLQLPEAHRLVFYAKLQLAESKKDEDLNESLEILQQVLNDCTKSLKSDHYHMLMAADKMVDTLLCSEEETHHVQAFKRQEATLNAILGKSESSENFLSLLARDRLASCYMMLNKHWDAKIAREQLLELQSECLDVTDPVTGETRKHSSTLDTMFELSKTYLKLSSFQCDCFEPGHVCTGDRTSESDSSKTPTVDLLSLASTTHAQTSDGPISASRSEAFGPHSPALTRGWREDAKEAFAQECVHLCRKTLDYRRNFLPETGLQIADCLEVLAHALTSIDPNDTEVTKLFEECLALRLDLLGEEHPTTTKIWRHLNANGHSDLTTLSLKTARMVEDWLEQQSRFNQELVTFD